MSFEDEQHAFDALRPAAWCPVIPALQQNDVRTDSPGASYQMAAGPNPLSPAERCD